MSVYKVRYRPSSKGSRELMNSEAMQTGLLSHANAIKDGCYHLRHFDGAIYVADVRPGKNRAHAMVKTTNYESILDNAKHNTMLKSMGG